MNLIKEKNLYIFSLVIPSNKNAKISFFSSSIVDIKLEKILTETLYDQKIFEQIKKILPKPSSFCKSNSFERQKINNKINKLFISVDKKQLLKNTHSIPVGFENEFLKFKSKIKIALKKKVPKTNSMLLINQLRQYIVYLISKFKKEGVKDLKNVSVQEVLKKIKPEVLFDKILLQSFNSSTLKTLISFSGKKEIEIIVSYVMKSISIKILLHLSYLILEKCKSLHIKMKDLFDESFFLIARKQNQKNLSFFQNVPRQLYNIFFNCLEIETITHFDSEAKTFRVKHKIPDKKFVKFTCRKSFPEIIPIDNTFRKSFEYIFTAKKPQKNVGTYSKVILSKKTVKALTTAQTKKFKINEEVLKIFEFLDSCSADNFKNITLFPFVPKNLLRKMLVETENLQLKIKRDDLQKYKDFWMKKKLNEKIIGGESFFKKISQDTQLCVKTVRVIVKFQLKQKKLRQYANLRMKHNTIIKIAKIYSGYPIFFSESFDYRLRMYPLSSLINRTSGIYKYLLQDFQKKTLKKNGLYTLLKAFYKNFPDKYEELIDLKNKNIENLLDWNRKNIKIKIKNILKCKSPIYSFSLFYELKKIVNQKLKTGILIEIDQKNSSSVFSAIIFEDKKLASLCNLNSERNKDLASFIMFKSENWYKNKINKDSLNILTTRREIHKKLLMCFYFGQTYFGRIQDLKTHFFIFEDINTVAKTYNNFLNDIFPNIVAKMDLLKSFISYLLSKTNSIIRIKTLDQSEIRWFFPVVLKKKIKCKTVSEYNKKKIYFEEFLIDAKKANVGKMCSSFLASYIHSLDAAVMRLLILEIKEDCNYVVSHLHDSLQFHPNFYEKILKSITKIYTSKFLKKIMDKTLINIKENLLEKNDLIYFKCLINKFKLQCDNIEIKKMSFNVKAMFDL